MPAAIFGIHETPKTFIPACTAATTSGTVDIPTASAPATLKNLISAGVSNIGPLQ